MIKATSINSTFSKISISYLLIFTGTLFKPLIMLALKTVNGHEFFLLRTKIYILKLPHKKKSDEIIATICFGRTTLIIYILHYRNNKIKFIKLYKELLFFRFNE